MNNKWLYDLTQMRGTATSDINLSLLFHKFAYGFRNGSSLLRIAEQRPRDYDRKFMQDVSCLSAAQPPHYHEVLERHYTAPGRDFCFRDMITDTRLLVGLAGTASVINTDITLHPYYGFPVIPASTIKGVARHFFKEVKGGQPPELWRIFEGERDSSTGAAQEGWVVFYDAWPTVWPPDSRLLVLDNMATHYSKYYGEHYTSEGVAAGTAANAPTNHRFPSDDDHLNLVFFLAVACGTVFRFAFRPSVASQKLLIQDALSLVVEALTSYGIGGKTGSSYGYFKEA